MVIVAWKGQGWPVRYAFPNAHAAVKRIGVLVFVATVILGLLWGYRRADYAHVKAVPEGKLPGDKSDSKEHANAAPLSLQWDSDCSTNMTYLHGLQERLHFGSQIEYGERYIQYTKSSKSRASITKVDEELFPHGFEIVDMETAPEPQQCIEPLQVTIPDSPTPSTVNASDVLFGISTTMSRLKDLVNIKEWSYWLTDGKGASNGGGLVVLLVDATKSEAQELQVVLNEVGILAEVQLADSSAEMAVRYLSMVPKLYESSLMKDRKWIALCDDDTFFPSLHTVMGELNKHDTSDSLYVGALSEDMHSIERHGSQAFGGAGVFISRPLASKITLLYPQCSSTEAIAAADSGWGPQGDILLRRCIYEHTEVRLSIMPGLSQLDIVGDASGFYESGTKPLSLHHFKGGQWHKANPYEMVKVSRVLGEDAFMMRFRTSDDFIISTGYSVAQYPHGIDFNTQQFERTFSVIGDDNGFNLDYVFGPQRQSLSGTGRKIGWQLAETILERNGEVRQVYFRKNNDGRWKHGEDTTEHVLNGVIVLIWNEHV